MVLPKPQHFWRNTQLGYFPVPRSQADIYWWSQPQVPLPSLQVNSCFFQFLPTPGPSLLPRQVSFHFGDMPSQVRGWCSHLCRPYPQAYFNLVERPDFPCVGAYYACVLFPACAFPRPPPPPLNKQATSQLCLYTWILADRDPSPLLPMDMPMPVARRRQGQGAFGGATPIIIYLPFFIHGCHPVSHPT